MLEGEPILMICPLSLAEFWWRPFAAMGSAVESVDIDGLLTNLTWTAGVEMLTDEYDVRQPQELSSIFVDIKNCRSIEAGDCRHRIIVFRYKESNDAPSRALDKCWVFFQNVEPYGRYLARVLLASGADFATHLVNSKISRMQVHVRKTPDWDRLQDTLNDLGFLLFPLDAPDPLAIRIERKSFVARAYSGSCIDIETGELQSYLALDVPVALQEALFPSKNTRKIQEAVSACGWRKLR